MSSGVVEGLRLDVANGGHKPTFTIQTLSWFTDLLVSQPGNSEGAAPKARNHQSLDYLLLDHLLSLGILRLVALVPISQMLD